jgi:hypothetical protein
MKSLSLSGMDTIIKGIEISSTHRIDCKVNEALAAL